MRHFYLIWNPLKPGTEAMAEMMRAYLEVHGCVGIVKGESMPVPEDTECVITLGGDGTLIRAARELAGRQIPIIGVNMGHLGYLTQIGYKDNDEVTEMLDDLMTDQFHLEKRMMLKGTIFHDGAVVKEDVAVNEILITRRGMPRLLNLRVSVNGAPLCHYKADGMIIATPTGSTAYNLSAGGPIVAPSAQMMIMTPICSHSLNGRSIVMPAEDYIEFEVMGQEDVKQAVAFDGGKAVSLGVGDILRVERSNVEMVMVKLKEVSFVDNLRSKMAGL